MKKMMILFLMMVAFSILLIGCEESGDLILKGADVCNTNGTYCHYMVTDADQVNLTFLVDNTFNYSVDMG